MTEPYENTLSIDELRREVRNLWDNEAALTRDFRDLPEVPSVETMYLLSSAAMNFRGADVLSIGKEMQRQHRVTTRKAVDGFDGVFSAIPYKCEYECAAGLWQLIRSALVADGTKD